MENLIAQLEESVAFIRSKLPSEDIEIGMVLGSGLGEIGDEIEDAVYIPYKDVPNFPVSTVQSHKGRYVIGRLSGRTVICMQGRVHFYEGYGMDRVVFPVQVMRKLGAKKLLVTNAAGCVNTEWNVGELMLIKDHIKLAGDCPMRGPNPEELGPRFFDMSDAYSKKARAMAKECAKKLGITVHEGVYELFTGPNFETPAEIRMARLLGADAVGMSTVPEVIAANHCGMEVLGISCLTNMAAGILDQPLSDEEVNITANRVKGNFKALVKEILKNWT